MEIFSSSTDGLSGDQLTLFAEAFPVNRFHTPGSGKAKTMTDISFRKCFELYQRSDRVGSSLKTFADCLVSTMGSYSRKLPHFWKAKVTRSKRFVFLLQPSMPRTDGTEFGLLRTPSSQEPGVTVERLETSDGQPAKLGQRAYDKETGRLAQVGLSQQLAMLATPTASESEQDLDKFKARMEKYPNGTTMPNLATQRSALPSLLPTPRALETETGKNAQGGISLTADVRLIPTPTTNDVSGGPNKVKVENGQFVRDAGTIDHSANLQSVIHGLQGLLPTPATRDFKGANSPEHLAKERGHHDQLPNALQLNTGLTLQPNFVEWMLGYPIEWTALKP